MTVQKFRKKPVVIEAAQWDGVPSTTAAISVWAEENNVALSHKSTGPGKHHLIIPTLEGDMRADVGDWIIKGVQGEFYPCKPDIFAETYDACGTRKLTGYPA